MATYRGKLHHLGKRLHVLAVDSRDDVVSSEVVKAKEIRSHQLDKASRTPTPRATLFLPGPHADSTTDLLRGSLSKSFASAVDKLDLDSSPTLVQYSPSMSALRKAKSMVGMFGKHQDPDKNSTKSKSSKQNSATYADHVARQGQPSASSDSPFFQALQARKQSPEVQWQYFQDGVSHTARRRGRSFWSDWSKSS